MHRPDRGSTHGPVRTAVLAGVLCLLVSASALAQTAQPDPELITDRPDFTESSEVVGRGVLQIESGLTFAEPGASVHELTLPQLLVRIGLGSRVELRLGSDGFIDESFADAGGRHGHHGGADVEIAAKVKLVDADTAGFDLALIPSLSLPTGSADFSSRGYDPGLTVTVARDLPRAFGLSANLNAANVSGPDGRAWTREASLSIGHALAGRFAAFWEGYGAFDRDGCDCTLDTGVTMALGPNRQADLEVGHGISGDSRGWFVGVGFAVRRLHH